MPIADQVKWDVYVEKNSKDPYSKACVDVAREVMQILETAPETFDPRELIIEADKKLDISLSGFMAGCVAQMVSACHSRGDEFRRKWNTQHQIQNEGDEANAKGGILNPAIMTFNPK